MRIFPVLILFAVCRLAAGSVDDVRNVPRAPEPRVAPEGTLRVFPLTGQYIAVAGVYDSFFNERIRRAYGSRLAKAEELLRAKKLPHWSYRFFFNFTTAEILADYLPEICGNFQNPDYFRITVNGTPVKPERFGYWLNAVGIKRTPHMTDSGSELSNSAELVPFSYLKLPVPLKDGDRLEIAPRTGKPVTLDFRELRTVSRALKVNQVGYAAEAGRKYAYLGMWLGELGAMPLGEFTGKPFHMRRTGDDAIVFSGTIAPRAKNLSIERKGVRFPLDGEEVMEMDFSPFSTPGEYYIHVPGVGKSWNFVVGNDAVGRAFYVQMRGLFHQRSGIAKEPKYTQWSMKSDRQPIYRGGFPPNDRQYGLIRDAHGKKAEKLRHFDVVRATATKVPVVPNVRGGWWDAGDFDRRTYHFQVVDALLSVYLMFPDNFSDSQLDIPESGNGVPDIIDEAAWGVDLWRRAQNEKGGVGCWIEATSHPLSPDPQTDTQPYYLAMPTRESSLQYSAHAAKLARAYAKCGNKEKAELFFKSADKAWRYAMDPANRASTSFTVPKRGLLTYVEAEKLPEDDQLKAALNLYLYSREEIYAEAMDRINFQSVLQTVMNARNGYYLSELTEETIPYLPWIRDYRNAVRKRAKDLLESQRELPYRNINWRLDSPYFTFLGWGAGLPFHKGSWLIAAWYIDGDPKYRDAALLCFDWMCGANPMGRSMTTGLGTVYPVRLLSLPMWAWRDWLFDPIPGLTPYTFDGRCDYSMSTMIFCFSKSERLDHAFKGFKLNLLPKSLGGGKPMTVAEGYRALLPVIPLWRRFSNVEGSAVRQNEFSVWETIAPAAAGYGALLQPGWRPPADWKARKPIPKLEDIPGYIFLP